MDGDQIRKSSSDQDLEYSQSRRKGVHYASIAEFLASLNINDTTLGSVRGVGTLSLEDYLKIVRSADKKEQGDGNSITLETKKISKKSLQEINNRQVRQSDAKNLSKSKLISQYTEKIWI
ncbi:uncharacterized protein [Drosophila takahashii]|uniref:uncharacterized protein n=1 Tax=Drosophila takahashii TaxID=29030 RepID=UPI001CF8CF4B|nr:uncharacterized protein LOC108060307 [Drosophila takahashii]